VQCLTQELCQRAFDLRDAGEFVRGATPWRHAIAYLRGIADHCTNGRPSRQGGRGTWIRALASVHDERQKSMGHQGFRPAAAAMGDDVAAYATAIRAACSGVRRSGRRIPETASGRCNTLPRAASGAMPEAPPRPALLQ